MPDQEWAGKLAEAWIEFMESKNISPRELLALLKRIQAPCSYCPNEDEAWETYRKVLELVKGDK